MFSSVFRGDVKKRAVMNLLLIQLGMIDFSFK